MSNWIEIGHVDDCKVHEMKRVALQDQRYLLTHGDSGYYFIDEMCSHEDYSLYLGCVQGDMIKCSLHGSRFQLKDGKALDDPAEDPIRSYPLKIEQGLILVCLE